MVTADPSSAEPSRGDPPGAGGADRRGPSPETADRVLTAAFHLLVTEGIGAVTPTRLFQETGVARTTIYRHWPDSGAVVADIIAGATRRDDVERYVGRLEPDLGTALSTLTFRIANRPLGALLAALLTADVARPTDELLGPTYLRGLLAPIVDVLVAASERGELATDADPVDLAADLAGPILLRGVLLRRPLDQSEVEANLTRFLATHRAD